jgi:hypothetical protein
LEEWEGGTKGKEKKKREHENGKRYMEGHVNTRGGEVGEGLTGERNEKRRRERERYDRGNE